MLPSHSFLPVSSLHLLQRCPPHSSPGPQQKLEMYRDTELLTWPSLKLQREHYPACPAPEYLCAQRKKIPSHPGDTELYQVRTQSQPDFYMKIMFN